MPPIQRGPAVNLNRLLEALPSIDRRRVLSECETVEQVFSEVLYTPWERLSHVYFPITSFISLIMPIDATASLEVGLIGNEGMFGIPLGLGVDVSPVRAVVQGAGSALRMHAVPFSRELKRSPALQREIDRYVFVHMSQLAQTAACTRFHVVEAQTCALAADDAGSGARGHFSYHAGIPGFHARRPPRRRHQGGELPAEAKSDPLQSRQHHCS